MVFGCQIQIHPSITNHGSDICWNELDLARAKWICIRISERKGAARFTARAGTSWPSTCFQSSSSISCTWIEVATPSMAGHRGWVERQKKDEHRPKTCKFFLHNKKIWNLASPKQGLAPCHHHLAPWSCPWHSKEITKAKGVQCFNQEILPKNVIDIDRHYVSI